MMFSFLRRSIGKFMVLLLVASLFLIAASGLADPTDPDGGDGGPTPPQPRPYSAILK